MRAMFCRFDYKDEQLQEIHDNLKIIFQFGGGVFTAEGMIPSFILKHWNRQVIISYIIYLFTLIYIKVKQMTEYCFSMPVCPWSYCLPILIFSHRQDVNKGAYTIFVIKPFVI